MPLISTLVRSVQRGITALRRSAHQRNQAALVTNPRRRIFTRSAEGRASRWAWAALIGCVALLAAALALGAGQKREPMRCDPPKHDEVLVWTWHTDAFGSPYSNCKYVPREAWARLLNGHPRPTPMKSNERRTPQ